MQKTGKIFCLSGQEKRNTYKFENLNSFLNTKNSIHNLKWSFFILEKNINELFSLVVSTKPEVLSQEQFLLQYTLYGFLNQCQIDF